MGYFWILDWGCQNQLIPQCCGSKWWHLKMLYQFFNKKKFPKNWIIWVSTSTETITGLPKHCLLLSTDLQFLAWSSIPIFQHLLVLLSNRDIPIIRSKAIKYMGLIREQSTNLEGDTVILWSITWYLLTFLWLGTIFFQLSSEEWNWKIRTTPFQ